LSFVFLPVLHPVTPHLLHSKIKMSSKGVLPNSGNDPRRSNRIYRYKPSANKPGEDPTADYLNLMGMIFSMCGLMMRVGGNKILFLFLFLLGKFFMIPMIYSYLYHYFLLVCQQIRHDYRVFSFQKDISMTQLI